MKVVTRHYVIPFQRGRKHVRRETSSVEKRLLCVRSSGIKGHRDRPGQQGHRYSDRKTQGTNTIMKVAWRRREPDCARSTFSFLFPLLLFPICAITNGMLKTATVRTYICSWITIAVVLPRNLNTEQRELEKVQFLLYHSLSLSLSLWNACMVIKCVIDTIYVLW